MLRFALQMEQIEMRCSSTANPTQRAIIGQRQQLEYRISHLLLQLDVQGDHTQLIDAPLLQHFEILQNENILEAQVQLKCIDLIFCVQYNPECVVLLE